MEHLNRGIAGQSVVSKPEFHATGRLPLAGFTSISTRLSACFSVTSSPARSRLGLTSSYRQMNGMHLGFGSGGFRRAICVHRGFVCTLRAASRSSAEEFADDAAFAWVTVSVVVAIALYCVMVCLIGIQAVDSCASVSRYRFQVHKQTDPGTQSGGSPQGQFSCILTDLRVSLDRREAPGIGVRSAFPTHTRPGSPFSPSTRTSTTNAMST